MLACNCLNISINAEATDFQKVDKKLLYLSVEEMDDVFFKEEILQVEKLQNINKLHPGLIKTKQVGSWIAHQCINCNIFTHAVHKDKGASCVLINPNLLRSETITRLKEAENFSKVYGILIEASEGDEEISTEYIPSEVEPTIKNFKDILSVSLKNEAYQVEKKIKLFTDQQYATLDSLREKAFSEQQAIIRTVLTHNTVENLSWTANSTKTIIPSEASITLPTIMTESLTNELKMPFINSTNSRHTPKRQKNSPAAQENSFDSEGLFQFDGIDDGNQDLEGGAGSEQDDDVTGRIDKGAHIKKTNRSSSISIAKSLPMDIPVFSPQMKAFETDDVDEDLPPEDNIDIAASIKKLAKSVHGNAVFGDLPRPRFSTQL